MCELTAATLATASLISGAVGTGAAVLGAYQQSRAAQAQANYQAKVADNNRIIAERQAVDARERGKLAEQQHRRQVSQLKGKQRNAFAASGVSLSEGSPVDIFADTEALGEQDAQTVRANAEREAYGFNVRAYNQGAEAGLQRGAAAQENPLFSGTTTFISGASSLSDKWYRYKKDF